MVFGFMCSLPLGLLGKDKKKLLLKKPTHSFLFLVLRASVLCREVVCGERGGAGVWLHSLCPWLDFTSFYVFMFHEAPSLVVQGQGAPRAAPAAGCPVLAGLTPPATLSLTGSPQ